jgi:hypothetical protein
MFPLMVVVARTDGMARAADASLSPQGIFFWLNKISQRYNRALRLLWFLPPNFQRMLVCFCHTTWVGLPLIMAVQL